MNAARLKVLVVGATGSIGRHVVDEAIKQGHTVRAIARNPAKARQLPEAAETFIADVTQPQSLTSTLAGVDGIIFTIGTDGGGKHEAESIDYGGVRNVLNALGSQTARIVLMTSIGVTNRASSYNRSTEAHDWKRRSERLLRASGLPYTIVRPGWFDYNAPDQHHLCFLQGDRRHAGSPEDGVISRLQLAQVLVASLSSQYATRKTFELVADKGPPQSDLEPLFAALTPDPGAALDGVLDIANMPLESEPPRVRDDLKVFHDRPSSFNVN
jgi:uncharacterized protein YbjT (DUF2867 family)